MDYPYRQPAVTLRALRDKGVVAVGRYAAPSTFRKTLTPVEALEIRSASIGIVVVFEEGARNALGGVAQGTKDGLTAREVAQRAGIPAAAPMFFAIDFEPLTSQVPLVRAYLKAAIQSCGHPSSSLYGAAWLCSDLAGDFPGAWVAGAWRGRIPSDARLFQARSSVRLCGVTLDEDRILDPHFAEGL